MKWWLVNAALALVTAMVWTALVVVAVDVSIPLELTSREKLSQEAQSLYASIAEPQK